MRARHFVVTIGVLLALAGCSPDEDTSAGSALPPVQLVELPAASAGGACILWDYSFLEDELGFLFDVAAADQVDDTSTCVVQSSGAKRPDLALSVVEHTDADADLFNEDMKPARASTVKGLGKAAYKLVSKAGGDHGPVIEIGWLSAAKQLMTLRFTFAPGASASDSADMTTRMIGLAKNLNGDDV